MATEQKYVKVKLTEKEITEHGRELARLQAERARIEGELKEVQADFKSKIASRTTQIEHHSTLVNNGYEYRNIECRVEMNMPMKGQKEYINVDTGEVVATAAMDKEDYQLSLT